MLYQILKKSLALVIATSILTLQANAIIYVYELDTEFSGGSEPVGPSPWASASFQDIDANTVQLELSNFNLTGSEFIGGWYLNFNDSLDVNNLSFNRTGGTAPADPTISTGLNAFKADGDGFFDILLEFSTASADQFGAGDTILYEISSINPINSQEFAFASAPGGGNGSWYSAAHVQGINGDFSGWIGSGPPVPIPEPSTYLMLTSLLGIVFIFSRRRKSLKQS